jgi:hypothetical protein
VSESARKHNVTGLKCLSIGTTKNGRGHVLTRYSINYKSEGDVPACHSFYFGKNTTQKAAFNAACDFLESLRGEVLSARKRTKIYIDYEHENLV